MFARCRRNRPGRLVAAFFALALVAGGATMLVTAQEAADGAPVPLSRGKPYTFDVRPPLRNYPDPEATELTDGILAPEDPLNFYDPEWVGFWSTQAFALTIDLGEVVPIRQVRSHHMAGVAGITWPTHIMITVSSDKIRWSAPLELVTPEPIYPDEVQSRWFVFDNLQLEGRWVQIIYFPPTEGKNIFIDEIEVY